MASLTIQDLSRQALIKGTTKFTDAAGTVGFPNEDIQTSALVRIADALEKQTTILAEPNPLSLLEYGELQFLAKDCRRFHPTVEVEEGIKEGEKLLRLCDLVEKLLGGIEKGGQSA